MSKLLPTKVADVIQVNGECLYFAGYVPQAPDTDVSQVQAQFNTCGECEGGSSLILPGDAGFDAYVELFCSGANQWECTVFVCNCVNEQYFASGVGEVVALTCGPSYPTGTVIIPIVDSNTGVPSGNATVTFS